MEKNQSWSKLPEKARKLVENNFLDFLAPTLHKIGNLKKWLEKEFVIPQPAAG